MNCLFSVKKVLCLIGVIMISESHANVEQLKISFKGRRSYRARNDMYSFDLFDDVWQLSTKRCINVSWIDEMGYDLESYTNIRLLMAEMASKLSVSTIRWSFRIIKEIGNNLSLAQFTIKWLSLTHTNKLQTSKVFSFAVNKANLTSYNEIYEFIEKNRPESKKYVNILDPEKGVYSEIEYQSIKEKMRLETDRQGFVA